jgi:CHAT domain-containing protein/Tfp pilus assembly protein PilF
LFLASVSVLEQTRRAESATIPCAEAELKPGLVVERIAKNSEGEKAGLAEGDVILSWSRGDAKGAIQSPFDLSDVEEEPEPLGRATLEGLRAGARQTWGVGPDKWGIQARPNFQGRLLENYRRGQELLQSGKLEEAAVRWRAAANDLASSKCSWLGPWLLLHAAQSFAEGKQWNLSDAFYQQAVERARSAEPRITVRLLLARAHSYETRGNIETAEKYYQLALDKARRFEPESRVVDRSLIGLGQIAEDRGDLDKAEEYFRQAFAMRERLAPGSLEVGRYVNDLGNVANDRGDLDKAGDYYLQALEIAKKIAPDGLDVANGLNNFGTVAYYRGDLDKADLYYQQAFTIRKKLGPETLEVAASLENLGNVATDRGDLAKAEEYQRRGIEILRRVEPNSPDLALALNNLGEVALDRGDLARAEQYCRRAIEIQRRIGPKTLDAAATLTNLGRIALERKDRTVAEAYYVQARQILEKVAPTSREEAATLLSLGELAHQRGDLTKTEQFCERAQEILRTAAPMSLDLAAVITSLGDVARDRRDFSKAWDYYTRALEIRQKLAPTTAATAEVLAALARIRREQERVTEATQLYAEAIEVLESQLSRLGGSSEIRAGFRAKHSDYYTAYADLLVSQKQPELAFQALERSRARTLIETLTEAHLDIRKGADPALLEQERRLQSILTAKSNRKINLLQAKHSDEQIAAIEKEISGYVRQYQEIEGQIRNSSPNYAALTQPQPLSVKEVQQQLLDPVTLLLEYTLGDKRSFVFVLSQNSLDAYELPKRPQVEDAANKVYQALTARNRLVEGETSVLRKARLTREDSECKKASAALSTMLLGPVAPLLAGKRLLVVADGALQYIPFAALPVPTNSPSDTPVPLVAEHEIVNLPSASVLAILRQQAAARSERHPTREVAVLADPVFDKNDPRVGRTPKLCSDGNEGIQKGVASESSRHLTRSVQDLGAGTRQAGIVLPRLAFSRREAGAIMTLTRHGSGMEALDFQASRETALSKELSEYRILHFATHGLLDNQHPELSGLVFSLVDAEGRPRDGFVDLQDVYNMNIPADLVVLSACETGLGKQVNGEGLIGLTRGFIYAGASRVVASLWKVHDVATSELMAILYKAMLQDGMAPASALRHAQLELQKRKIWANPYYWAAFTLQGEWR